MPSIRPALGSRLRRLLLAALAIVGCREASAPDAATLTARVVVQLATWVDPTARLGLMTLTLGDSTRLAARAFAADGQRLEDASAEWSSSDPSVAEVRDGRVRSRRAGRVIVRATVGATSDSVEFRIVGPATRLALEIPAFSQPVSFDDTLRLEGNGDARISAALFDVAGNRLPILQTDPALEWRILDTTRATVGALGNGIARVAAARLGRTRVVATAFGFTDTAEVLVRVGAGLSLPIPIAGSIPFRRISLRAGIACGVSMDERLFCWGSGAIGTGRFSYDTASAPRAIAPDLRFTAVAVGGGHSCALDSRGEAYCWGSAAFGQTGTLGLTPYAPTPVVGELSFTGISLGGAHSCALDAGGTLYCWGQDANGALGIAATAPLDCGEWDPQQNRYVQLPCRVRPTRVEVPARFVEIAAGGTFTCGRSDTGEVWCWGAGIGAGAGSGSRVPVRIPGIAAATSITAGGAHSCAIVADGSAYCWGDNGEGQLGDGTTVSRAAPSPVAGGHRFRHLAAGAYATCGVTEDGRVRCWGSNRHPTSELVSEAPRGVLGTEELTQRLLSPTPVLDPVREVAELVVGSGNACARRADGMVDCWGVAGWVFGAGGVSRTLP